MKIYLDNCCFNRLFDNQTDHRIRLESEAVKIILNLCEQNKCCLITSRLTLFEIGNTPDESRRNKLEMMVSISDFMIELSPEIISAAKNFELSGLKAFDAIHLACADAHADILMTVDDKFLKKALSMKKLNIKVGNPLKWLEEVML